MKTTLVLDDTVAKRLKREAEERGTTMSALVEDAVRAFLEPPTPKKLRPMPTFDGGEYLVDINDRDALYRAMEEEP